MEKKLNELLEEIHSNFNYRRQKIDQHCFSLICWKNGLWSIKVTDDWHKWIDKGIEEPRYLFSTPEEACGYFLQWMRNNKINLKELQSSETD